jgi:tRNA-modifying protein YgfZ
VTEGDARLDAACGSGRLLGADAEACRGASDRGADQVGHELVQHARVYSRTVATTTAPAVSRPRAYVRVKGPDAEDYLQRMLSNDMTQRGMFDALLLTPKGRLIATLRVWRRDDDDFLLLTEPELGDVVQKTLLRTRFAAKCEIELEQHTSTLVLGDAEGLPGEVPGTVEVLDAEIPETLDPGEFERTRIAAGVPAWGKELDGTILPAEAGLDETHISFTKGCYPGQEPIVRLHHRGHLNRRLRVLEVESAQAGDEIDYEGKTVGRITSAVPGFALGYVRTEVPDEAELSVRGAVARLHLTPARP